MPPFPNQNSESLIGQNGGVAYVPTGAVFCQITQIGLFDAYTNSDVVSLACILS